VQDHLLGRLRADHQDAFSEGVTRSVGRVRARLGSRSGDPLPLVARAMALVLAVSLTGLTVTVTGY